MIETKQLEYFIKCAELGSFSRAAEVLHTTQPNVSKVIKTFELELNMDLFVRGRNTIELNEKGKAVYPFACDIMERIRQLMDDTVCS